MRAAVLLLFASAAAAGCSTYDTAFLYDAATPAARVDGPAGPAGRVQGEVLGVRETQDGAAAIDLRIRVERHGATPVALRPSELRLVAGRTRPLDAAGVRAAGPSIPAAGGAATFDASFPLPGRDPRTFDLRRLDLHVALDVDGHRETVALGFVRGATAYYWADPWGWPGPDPNGIPTGWRQ